MRLDFYYFSYQCPLNDDMLRLLDEYRDKMEIHLHDISDDSATAERMDIFFPTLTVLDGQRRYYSPLSRSFLDRATLGIFPEEHPFLPYLSEKCAEYVVRPIQSEDVSRVCGCCGSPSQSNCLKKSAFLQRFNQEIYGFLHEDSNGILLGGAEYLPSEKIPYHIPRDKQTAFVTCVYMSDTEYDYKSAPLKALEHYLTGKYSKVIAVSDESGVFPNGNLEFFLRNGYHDQGILFEDPNYCRLHLVSKELK